MLRHAAASGGAPSCTVMGGRMQRCQRQGALGHVSQSCERRNHSLRAMQQTAGDTAAAAATPLSAPCTTGRAAAAFIAQTSAPAPCGSVASRAVAAPVPQSIVICRAAAGSADVGDVGGFLNMLGQMMQQSQSSNAPPTGAALAVQGLSYQPPGTPAPLLQDVSLQLPANSMGLIYGRSGAGKTTLLKIIGGLAQHDTGMVRIGSGALDVATAAIGSGGSDGDGSIASAAGSSGNGSGSGNGSTGSDGGGGASAAAARTAQTGLVFQFPERHFLGGTIGEELTFGWPQRPEDMFRRQQMTLRLGKVLAAVGLDKVDLQAAPASLSDGYKRRLALAVQLARGPAVLLLDEPLAGLDWRARVDIADLLGKLKQECTIVVVSHDLHELSEQVDKAWEMLPGGKLQHRPNWRSAL